MREERGEEEQEEPGECGEPPPPRGPATPRAMRPRPAEDDAAAPPGRRPARAAMPPSGSRTAHDLRSVSPGRRGGCVPRRGRPLPPRGRRGALPDPAGESLRSVAVVGGPRRPVAPGAPRAAGPESQGSAQHEACPATMRVRARRGGTGRASKRTPRTRLASRPAAGARASASGARPRRWEMHPGAARPGAGCNAPCGEHRGARARGGVGFRVTFPAAQARGIPDPTLGRSLTPGRGRTYPLPFPSVRPLCPAPRRGRDAGGTIHASPRKRGISPRSCRGAGAWYLRDRLPAQTVAGRAQRAIPAEVARR